MQQNENSIVLFTNKFKTGNSKQPDLTGKINVNGRELRVNGRLSGTSISIGIIEGDKLTGFTEIGSFLVDKAPKKSDKAPDKTGTGNIDGKNLSIALWVKEGASGRFLAGKISEPTVNQVKPQVVNTAEVDEEDSPF